MGVVYRATQLALRRPVALKVIAGELAGDERFRERFRREGLAQAALDHPNIVTVYEAGETDGALFIAMRLVPGPSLRDLVRSGQLDDARTLSLLAQVASALDTAHEAGLIHRDVKPANVLVGPRDHAYLADFGLIKGVDAGTLTQTQAMMGTLAYVAPEQIRGDAVGSYTDGYALASMLVECLTGQPPFPKPTEAAVLFAHMSDAPPRLTERRPDLPAAMDAVIERGLAKDPEQRFGSASELIAAARGALGISSGVPVESYPPAPWAGAGHTPAGGWPGTGQTPPAAGHTPPGGLTPPGAITPAPAPAPPPFPAPASPVHAPIPVADRTIADVAPARPQVEAYVEPDKRRRRLIIAVGCALTGGIALGVLVALLTGGGPAALDAKAGIGELGFDVPATWQETTPPAVPGIPAEAALGVSAPGGTLMAAMVSDATADLLPEDLVRAIEGKRPKPDAVKLGTHEALRSSDLRVRGVEGRLTVYAVPTNLGAATVLCLDRADAPETFAETCRRSAATLRLTDAKSLKLAPQPGYARDVSKALSELGEQRGRIDAAMRTTKSDRGRAGLLADAALAYKAAAKALGKIAPGPRERAAHEALTDAVGVAGRAYERTASAARRSDRVAYEARGKELADALRLAVEAQNTLKSIGYRIGA